MYFSTSAASLFFLAASLVRSAPLSDSSNADLLRRQDLQTIKFHDSCSAYRKLIDIDINEMVRMAKKAAENAKPGNKYYDAIFGRESDDNGQQITDFWIQDRFLKISEAKTKVTHVAKIPTIRCDAANAPSIGSRKPCVSFGAPALTVGAGQADPVIWLCNSYWQGRKGLQHVHSWRGRQVPLDPYIPTSGYLLHEWTHAWYGTIDAVTEGGKAAYGQKEVLNLKRERGGTAKGRKNADSYRVFAAAVALGGDWSVDPNKLSREAEDL